jgi:endonuclease-3
VNISTSPKQYKQTEQRLRLILGILNKEYPQPRTALTYGNPFQLLIAVILSAQCTDQRVNQVTPVLFSQLRTPHDFANADTRQIERLIHSTGFFRNKAKNIKACAQALIRDHNGMLPDTMALLNDLPGVGRKTANVVLGEVFGKVEGIVVDTHVARLSQRLGLTKEKNAVTIERDLMSILPKRNWYRFSHSLILHGRAVCKARTPDCRHCPLQKFCPSSTVFT